ncbi:zinc ion binding [Sparganum proliferum]
MDFRVLFRATVASKEYNSYAEFKQRYKAFTKATGTKFFKGPPSTTRNHNGELVPMRKVTFYCIFHSTTLCPVYFQVRGTRQDSIIISKHKMVHNHEVVVPSSSKLDRFPNSSMYYVRSDLTAEFINVFSSLTFSTFQELKERLLTFSECTGSRYRVTRSRLWPAKRREFHTLRYQEVFYGCATRSLSSSPETVRCRSRIRVASASGSLHVIKYNLRHNHKVKLENLHNASDTVAHRSHQWPKDSIEPKERGEQPPVVKVESFASVSILREDDTCVEKLEKLPEKTASTGPLALPETPPVTFTEGFTAAKAMETASSEDCISTASLSIHQRISEIASRLLEMKELALICDAATFRSRLSQMTAIIEKWRRQGQENGFMDEIPLVFFVRNPVVLKATKTTERQK